MSLLQSSGESSTQAQLMEIAANSAENALNFNLTGLVQSGMAFI